MAKRTDEQLSGLPETTVIGAPHAELDALLREAHSLKGFEDRLKEVKKRIVDLAQGYPGVRYGNLCAIVRWQDGSARLDRELLVENGVSPEQIKASMKQGEGHWVCELPKIEG